MEIDNYKVLSSKLIYDGWMKVYQERILLPDNTEMIYTFAEQREAAIVLPVIDGKVVMVKQFRVPIKKTQMELPAGLAEPGEKPEDTAKRELQEETGYIASEIIHLVSFYPASGQMNFKLHVFFARGLKKSRQKLDSTEFLEVHHVPLEEFTRLVKANEVEGSVLLSYFYAKEKKLI